MGNDSIPGTAGGNIYTQGPEKVYIVQCTQALQVAGNRRVSATTNPCVYNICQVSCPTAQEAFSMSSRACDTLY